MRREQRAVRPLPADSRIRRDPAIGTIVFLKGDGLSGGILDDAAIRRYQVQGRLDELALAFLEVYREAFGLDAPRDELRVDSIRRDDLGFTHVKLQQVYHGIPVDGAQLIVHFGEDGNITLVDGHYVRTPREVEDAVPMLSAAEARRYAGQEIRESFDCQGCPADVVIVASSGESARLGYRIRATVSLSQGWEFLIDAKTGEVLRKIPTVLSGIHVPIGRDAPLVRDDTS